MKRREFVVKTATGATFSMLVPAFAFGLDNNQKRSDMALME